MKIHVLAGDALAEDFRGTAIDGKIVVCCECLIEGDLQAASLEEFWNVRAKYIATVYGEPAENYREKVGGEFEKLQGVTQNAEVNLWFEYDLFCGANMWFCTSLLQNRPAEIYRVAPVVRDETDVWKGFGNLKSEDLEQCYSERIKFSAADVELGAELWKAFQNKNFDELEKLGATESECFPKLAEVCEAAIEIQSRPKKKILREIIARFSETAGVYGF